MHWTLWLLLSNIAIFWLEFSYRKGNYGTFFEALPYIIIPIMIGQLGLYNGFKYANSLLLAGATFTMINISLRVVNTIRLGEHLNMNYWNWFGVVLLIISMILLKIK